VVTLADLRATDEFDLQNGSFIGVSDDLLFPSWKRQGRIVIQSEDGFPFEVQAVIPVVQVGDLDDTR